MRAAPGPRPARGRGARRGRRSARGPARQRTGAPGPASAPPRRLRLRRGGAHRRAARAGGGARGGQVVPPGQIRRRRRGRGRPAAAASGRREPRPGAAVLHPGAGYGSKRWPPARFAAVARALAAQGHEVVITGTAAERGLAARVAAAAGLPETANLAGTTGIGSLLALVHEAALVISGDTGVAHLATAYERPSVVLFGPASPRIWGPPAKPCHVALWHGTGEREVLADRPDPALLRITVPEVLAAAARVLAASPA
ncbi:glycosyltransferase family 9 protein [Thermocatellispora tengchongensis]|uniref:glycosyltransferase family 9 protein n=1 Tax=Thermocatellispora tengchongensis TaxID=1073253 RepID=UPI00362778CE